jgi:hypothetical protein
MNELGNFSDKIFFRYTINDKLMLIQFDSKLDLVENENVESHIFWAFIKSVSIGSYLMYSIGCYNEEKDDFLWKQLVLVTYFTLNYLCKSFPFRLTIC